MFKIFCRRVLASHSFGRSIDPQRRVIQKYFGRFIFGSSLDARHTAVVKPPQTSWWFVVCFVDRCRVRQLPVFDRQSTHHFSHIWYYFITSRFCVGHWLSYQYGSDPRQFPPLFTQTTSLAFTLRCGFFAFKFMSVGFSNSPFSVFSSNFTHFDR